MFLVVLIPDFHLQTVLRVEPELRDQPVALIAEEAKPTILQISPTARRAGVTTGMTPTQAQARCRAIVFRNYSIQQEAITSQILLQTVQSVSPFVEATGNGICTADLKNCRRNDRTQLAERVVEQLEQLSLRAQAGLAVNPDLALLAAQVAAPVLVIQNDLSAFHQLPIDSLIPVPEMQLVLGKWGIRTIGQFSALPKDQITFRLGAEAAHWWDLAMGWSSRVLRLTRAAEVFEEAIDFEREIEQLEPLLFVLRRFLEQLSLRLTGAYLVARELRLQLTFSDGTTYERRFKIPSPTRHVDTLFRVLYARLENFTAGAPVIALRLIIYPTRPVSDQFELLGSSLRDPNRFFETIARLTALIGEGQVGTPVREAGLRPDGLRAEPLDFHAAASRSAIAFRPSGSSARTGLALSRFRPPLPAEVIVTAQGTPQFLKTAEFGGEVCQLSGYWSSSGEWWSEEPWDRQEWDVRLSDGGLYRIFREQDQWFVEGLYD